MKLIMRSVFDELRKSDKNLYDTNKNGEDETIRLYRGEKLIAKKVNKGKKISYFGIKGCEEFI